MRGFLARFSSAVAAVVALTTLASPAVAAPRVSAVQACPAADLAPGFARCFSWLRTDLAGLRPDGAPSGYGPADLQSAYQSPSSSGGEGQTVAIVDAFDDPTAEADMNVYRAKYGLPPCTIRNGCFRKVNQRGRPFLYPINNPNWAVEISLDLDMVSALCPRCNILLVEADNSLTNNLAASVDTAAMLGANAISNSYGGPETSSELAFDVHYRHPGVAVTASAGDSGYGVQYPAASPNVIAVGGTSLSPAANARGWTESAWGGVLNGRWAGTGSGCSQFEPKPDWQRDTGCAQRTVADVAAVADPATGVAIYDSFRQAGWLVAGGTSASAPIIASMFALAGNAASATNPASFSYDAPTDALNDITSGTDSQQGCSPDYLCNAQPGYDGPTGNGTPNGVGAF